MLLTKTVLIKWNRSTCTHYKELGYIFTKVNDEFEVKVEDLYPNTKTKVDVQCDYCDKVISKSYKKYLDGRKIVEKDCCKQCTQIKVKECNLIVHGVIHPMQLDSVQEKSKQTNLERYGVDSPCKSETIMNKVKQTNLDRLGVEYTFQSKEVQEKSKQTCMDRYGVECVFQLEDVKNKIKVTNLKRYGYDNVLKSPIIKEKIKMSLYKNKTGVSSYPQRYICSLINGELNYPIGNLSLDIVFLDEKIYIEYDGSGHDLRVVRGQLTEKEFNQKEIVRNYVLKSLGWRQIRIISKLDYIPQDDKIIDIIGYAKNYLSDNHSWINFNIDTNTIINSLGTFKFDFGKTHQVREKKVINI